MTLEWSVPFYGIGAVKIIGEKNMSKSYYL